MKKISNIDLWIPNKATPNSQRIVHIKISLKHIDSSTLRNDSPLERKVKSMEFLESNLKKLIDTNLLKKFKVKRIDKKAYSVITNVNYPLLSKLNKLDCISDIWINKMSQAKKIRRKPEIKYFCVRMTIAIQIEGQTKGRQTIEDRFIVIKAKTFEDAYKKTEKYAAEYESGVPYMNSKGQLVRWKIESYDDCYEIGNNLEFELKQPEGAEVYSKLRTRNLKNEYVWDGK